MTTSCVTYMHTHGQYARAHTQHQLLYLRSLLSVCILKLFLHFFSSLKTRIYTYTNCGRQLLTTHPLHRNRSITHCVLWPVATEYFYVWINLYFCRTYFIDSSGSYIIVELSSLISRIIICLSVCLRFV